MKGTVIFTDEVIGKITDITLREGRITIEACVQGPHPEFNANQWRVHGDDGSLIYTVVEGRTVMMTPAQPVGFTTHAFCPVELVGGDVVEPL